MIFISRNIRKHKNEKALTLKDVRESRQHYCFHTVEKKESIIITADNDKDYLGALEDYQQIKRENPDKTIILRNMETSGVMLYTPTYQLLPSQRSRDFAQHAFTELKKIGLIENNLKEETWLYIFGYSNPGSQSMKIKWLGTKENLRHFLSLWYEPETRNKQITFAEIKRHVPLCFVKKGNPMGLSKKVTEYSERPQLIEKIFRPNEND